MTDTLTITHQFIANPLARRYNGAEYPALRAERAERRHACRAAPSGWIMNRATARGILVRPTGARHSPMEAR
mgnify:CR=1 FL=1